MRFVCPKCSAKYAVAEDKIPVGKAVRFTCRKCGHVFRLRRRASVAAAQAAQPQAAQPQTAPAPQAPVAEAPAPVADEPAEWFAMVSGQQRGPMTRSDLGGHIAAKQVHEASFVWKEGMADWKALNEVPELAELAQQAPKAPASPFAAAAAGLSADQHEYLERPAGEQTRLFMNTAGIFKRRRRQRIAAVLAGIFVLSLAGIVYADSKGMIMLPGMGKLYEVSGRIDPNAERGLARAQERLNEELSAEEKAKLDALMAEYSKRLEQAGKPVPRKKRSAGVTPDAGEYEEGIQESGNMDDAKKDLLANMFADTRKQEATLKLAKPKDVKTPNLPDGLTAEAIVKVIEGSKTALENCADSALKSGENIRGRMDVTWTINPTGKVAEASIIGKKKNTELGKCIARAIKRWKFPAFNGQPVPVRFPLVF